MLASLAPVLAALPVPAHDPGAVERDRARLLRAASRPRSRSRTVAFAAIAVASAAAVTVVVSFRDRGHPTAMTSRVSVQASAARWSRHDEPGTTLVRLDDGELELHVAGGDTAHRLVVSVPDGELDDLGTTFRVTVSGGSTTAIAVLEGAVVARLIGRPPVFLVAGERWAPAPIAPPVVTTTPAREPAPAAVPAKRPSRAAVPPPTPPPPPAAPPPSLSAELSAAVRLYERGDLGGAIDGLRAFIVHHGTNPRAEDARYLLVLALQRSNDPSGARDAARDYLGHHPDGFRRAEIEAIAK